MGWRFAAIVNNSCYALTPPPQPEGPRLEATPPKGDLTESPVHRALLHSRMVHHPVAAWLRNMRE